ncbi:hypothetical protein D3C84_912380 [compost metagenome]
MLDVFSASSVHMAGVAVFGSGFSFCSSCIALMPIGVAALPSPSKFAAILLIM